MRVRARDKVRVRVRSRARVSARGLRVIPQRHSAYYFPHTAG